MEQNEKDLNNSVSVENDIMPRPRKTYQSKKSALKKARAGQKVYSVTRGFRLTQPKPKRRARVKKSTLRRIFGR